MNPSSFQFTWCHECSWHLCRAVAHDPLSSWVICSIWGSGRGLRTQGRESGNPRAGPSCTRHTSFLSLSFLIRAMGAQTCLPPSVSPSIRWDHTREDAQNATQVAVLITILKLCMQGVLMFLFFSRQKERIQNCRFQVPGWGSSLVFFSLLFVNYHLFLLRFSFSVKMNPPQNRKALCASAAPTSCCCFL